MPNFHHAEGTAVDEDNAELVFFTTDAASEHWFPDYDRVALDLWEADIDTVLHMLTAAETVAGAFGPAVTISSNHDVAYRLAVDAPDNGEGFSDDVHEIEFRITNGLPASARWTTTHEWSADKISTQWLTREQLQQMRTGAVPPSTNPQTKRAQMPENTDIRLARTLRTLDPSVHDEGECVPFSVTIRITENDIIVDVEEDLPTDGMKRSVWIEQQGSLLVVHCYDPQHEEPINVRIGAADITVDTDREGGHPHVVQSY